MKRRTVKTKKVLIIVAITMLSLVGVIAASGSILKWAYGIREPRVENAQSLLQTATRYGLEPGNIVTVAPSAYHDLFNDFSKSVPEAMIFDRQGRYIEYKTKSTDCNAGLFAFIPRLQKGRTYNLTGKTTLTKELNGLRDLQGAPLRPDYLDTAADFHVLISWTAFSGRLNKDHVQAWQNLAAKNRGARIQVVEVNFDTQQWWPAAARDTLMQKLP